MFTPVHTPVDDGGRHAPDVWTTHPVPVDDAATFPFVHRGPMLSTAATHTPCTREQAC